MENPDCIDRKTFYEREREFLYILVEYLCIFISRPGRRPLGFLSLICPKNSLDSDEATQTHSKKRLKPHIPASRRNLKKPNLLNTSQKKTEESSSDPLPSPSITDPQSDDTGKSAAQVCENCCILHVVSTRENVAIYFQLQVRNYFSITSIYHKNAANLV